ncbi:hypothetical protein ECZU28_40020 [Escherichia coli]|nr:hypothetical protein ECZU28_40020 [Escherichia coli]
MVRVKFVKSAQRLGFSLDEIAELLRLDDGTHCEEASSPAEHKLRTCARWPTWRAWKPCCLNSCAPAMHERGMFPAR